MDGWVTVLVVAFLEVKMKDEKDMWELVADKAKKIVTKELGNDSKLLEEVLSKAKEAINA